MRAVKIFSGNANVPLALEIARYLNTNLGQATVTSFSDGETRVRVDENVRGDDVFVIQSLSDPVNMVGAPGFEPGNARSKFS